MPIRIQLDLFPELSGLLSIQKCFSFFNGYYNCKKHKNYIVGKFLTIRIYSDYFPVISGWLSVGYKSKQDLSKNFQLSCPSSQTKILRCKILRYENADNFWQDLFNYSHYSYSRTYMVPRKLISPYLHFWEQGETWF